MEPSMQWYSDNLSLFSWSCSQLRNSSLKEGDKVDRMKNLIPKLFSITCVIRIDYVLSGMAFSAFSLTTYFHRSLYQMRLEHVHSSPYITASRFLHDIFVLTEKYFIGFFWSEIFVWCMQQRTLLENIIPWLCDAIWHGRPTLKKYPIRRLRGKWKSVVNSLYENVWKIKWAHCILNLIHPLLDDWQ